MLSIKRLPLCSVVRELLASPLDCLNNCKRLILIFLPVVRMIGSWKHAILLAVAFGMVEASPLDTQSNVQLSTVAARDGPSFQFRFCECSYTCLSDDGIF